MVITVFGDLVQHRGGQVSTAKLGQVLGRVGVEQGALRTALSRLARDGWVQVERIGRTSHYRLSQQGLARFAPATMQIYAPVKLAPVARWAMVLKLGATGRQEVTVCPLDDVVDQGDCLVSGDLCTVSGAYRASLLEDDHRFALAALAADITALAGVKMSEPLESAAARVLLIHRWRRIVLRFPDIPWELMPKDAPLANPRHAVAEAYWRLSEPGEAWMGCDITASAPNNQASGRFKPD
ncbi:MAG: hypothetical protein L3J36_14490 [Rhodobacteraceae bacterium]|nr:hypothetical protein [Paracoccaceae bacterium]